MMSTITIIVLTANGITAVLAAALLMLVLWQAPRQRVNQYFALAMLALVLYCIANGFGRFIDDLNLDPEHATFFAITVYCVFVVAMFYFASEFAQDHSPTVRAMRMAGLALFAVQVAGMWSGLYTSGIRPVANENGSYQIDWTTGGHIGTVILLAYLAVSAIVLFQTRDSRGWSLWIAPALAIAQVLSSVLIWPVLPIPLAAMFLAAVALALGLPVLRRDLFYPIVQMNAELAQKNRALQKANRLKGEFLANMSHELRTPLNSIIGYTELVLNGTYGALNDTQRDRLEKVVRNGHSLLNLINDVLDLSRIETGRITLERRVIVTPALLDSVLALIEPLALQKGLTITRDFAGAPPLYGDETRVRQIVTNIIANAIKFTESGGVTLRATRDDGMLCLEIADTGIGIPSDQYEMVFAEFQQIDSSSTRRYEGTGLGLAITKRLVEMHGGKIWLESAVGQGTTFYVTLPVAAGSTAALAEAPTRQPNTVLIVDDNADTVQLLADVLGSAGYHTATAFSGPDALRIAQEIKPDLITLDVMMPGLSGWQVLRKLKEEPETRAIPVVIVSVIDNHPLAISLGANDAITKPLNSATLLKTLGRTLAQTRTNDPILVIDNREDDRELIASTLKHQGYQVECVTSGAQALTWLEHHVPSLIMLDLLMPGVSGFDILEAVRTNARLASVPVVVITAKDLTHDERAMLRERYASLLQKGLAGPDVLLHVVQEALTAPRERV
jgi:signal transduction histidine kinase/CheY-like chemotaxis protein